MVLILILASCSSGELLVEKSPSILTKKGNAVRKVIIIEPDFAYIKKIKRVKKKYIKTRQLESDFGKTIKDKASKLKISATVIDANNLQTNNVDYFNYLLPLKKEILRASFMQKSESNFVDGSLTKESFNKLKKAPVISSKYSHLSKKYRTPFFSVQGVVTIITPNKIKSTQLLFPPSLINAIINPKETSFYYNIIANVNTGEVVFREMRVFDRFPTKGDLGMMIYDSFKILNHKK